MTDEFGAQDQAEYVGILQDIARIDLDQPRKGSMVSQSDDPWKLWPVRMLTHDSHKSVVVQLTTKDSYIDIRNQLLNTTPFQGKQDKTLGVHTSNIL
jgi:hypothetical protein